MCSVRPHQSARTRPAWFVGARSEDPPPPPKTSMHSPQLFTTRMHCSVLAPRCGREHEFTPRDVRAQQTSSSSSGVSYARLNRAATGKFSPLEATTR